MRLILTISVEQIFVDEMLTASQKHKSAIQIRDRREEWSRDLSERMQISAMQSPHEQKCEEYDKPVYKTVRHCHCCCCDIVVVAVAMLLLLLLLFREILRKDLSWNLQSPICVRLGKERSSYENRSRI